MKFTATSFLALVAVPTSFALNYWKPPLDANPDGRNTVPTLDEQDPTYDEAEGDPVSCENKRIVIPEHGEFVCMNVGQGICRDSGGFLGKWRFGISDRVDTGGSEFEHVGWNGSCKGETAFAGVYDPAHNFYPLTDLNFQVTAI